MPQKSLEDELNEAFKKFQQEARKTAEAKGKREVTQEEYEQIPLVQLNKLYSEWKAPLPKWKTVDLYDSAFKRLSRIQYSLTDAIRFHEVNSDVTLEFALFMCAVGAALQDERKSHLKREYLKPYFQSNNILPQLQYLVHRSSAAKVNIEGLDTVVLISCETADLKYLDIPQSASLVIDCELGKYQRDVGNNMKSGQLVLRQKTKPTELGWYMHGGTLVYEGDLVDVSIGENMGGGNIVVNGNVSGDSSIGHQLKGNEGNAWITIKGDYRPNERATWGIGHEMHGGYIKVEKDIMGKIPIGDWMEGGIIMVNGNVYQATHVGNNMKNGASIHIDGNCTAWEIGSHMEGGFIHIGKDGGDEIGSCMKNGSISIEGNATSQDHRIGDMMDGGSIIIGGNAGIVSNLTYGGQIQINGTFRGEYVYGGLAKVYEKDRLIVPGLMARMMGKLERGQIQR